jgi:2-phospho-L-lactate/phosphoenolpyruvate guanylyltransferase
MNSCAIVPVKRFNHSKSRLSLLLCEEERAMLSRFLLEDTLNTLRHCRSISKIIVVCSDPSAEEITKDFGIEFLHQAKDAGVNDAVSCADRFLNRISNWISVIIPCDLPLLLPRDIDYLFRVMPEGRSSVTICPSYKFDGTNLLLRNPSQIISDTMYDNDSFQSHVTASIAAGAITKILLAKRLMIDLDTPEDLELLLNKRTPSKSISYLKQITNANSRRGGVQNR